MRPVKLIALLILGSVILFGTSCHCRKKGKGAEKNYTWMLYHELKKELYEAEVKKDGDTVRVIYPELAMFDFGKDEIKTKALPAFTSFAAILKNYDRIHFVINGYTDNVGADDANLSLSKRRADNTKILMKSNGVQEQRMTTRGLGATNFVMANTTPDGRKANRRVEFILYEVKK